MPATPRRPETRCPGHPRRYRRRRSLDSLFGVVSGFRIHGPFNYLRSCRPGLPGDRCRRRVPYSAPSRASSPRMARRPPSILPGCRSAKRVSRQGHERVGVDQGPHRRQLADYLDRRVQVLVRLAGQAEVAAWRTTRPRRAAFPQTTLRQPAARAARRRPPGGDPGRQGPDRPPGRRAGRSCCAGFRLGVEQDQRYRGHHGPDGGSWMDQAVVRQSASVLGWTRWAKKPRGKTCVDAWPGGTVTSSAHILPIAYSLSLPTVRGPPPQSARCSVTGLRQRSVYRGLKGPSILGVGFPRLAD